MNLGAPPMATPPTSLSVSLDSAFQFLLRRRRTAAIPSFLALPTLPRREKLFRLSSSSSSPSSPPPCYFLDADDRLLEIRRALFDGFVFTHQFDHGSMEIHKMADEELDEAVQLLADSIAESIWGGGGSGGRYADTLAFMARQYLVERMNSIPHAVVLVGIYRGRSGGGGEEAAQLACAAEVSFCGKGSHAGGVPTPAPPPDRPYVCNMTVKMPLRRKGIGWHLLKACEELVFRATTTKASPREVYLHCRVIDKGPLAMYTKAGYKVKKTDSLLTLLTFRRRKHLMFKQLLPESDGDSRPED